MAILALPFFSNNVTFGTKTGAGEEKCGTCKSLNLKALRRKFILSFPAFLKVRKPRRSELGAVDAAVEAQSRKLRAAYVVYSYHIYTPYSKKFAFSDPLTSAQMSGNGNVVNVMS